MTDVPQARSERRHLELRAALVFGVIALSMTGICAGVIVSGWFAGVIEDRFERVFWLGAVLGLVAVLMAAVANLPLARDDVRAGRAIRLLLRIAIGCFVIAPVLCLGALAADFFL